MRIDPAHPGNARSISLFLRGSKRILASAVMAVVAGIASACSLLTEPGVAGEDCGPLPYFTALPVSPADIDLVAVFGGLGAPASTLPKAHSGFLLNKIDVPVFSPGNLQVTSVRRTTYVQSPNREGKFDYAVFFKACKDVEGWFGHLTTITAAIPDEARDCETYSTFDETVEACSSDVDAALTTGMHIGTGGLSIELGLVGLDFGLLDNRVSNFYVNAGRYPKPTFNSVCPYAYFDSANRETLFSLIRDGARPYEAAEGEPRCGTMAVDVAGTAKGVWAETGVTGSVTADQTRFITLADYPYRPEERLALSLGPVELGARVAMVPKEATGRVNRPFEQVSEDEILRCYTPSPETDRQIGESWLLSLSAARTLTIERIGHGLSPSPCVDDPASWAFTEAALTFVR